MQLANEPDLNLYNGRIYTCDAEQPWAEAVAIRKHRFLAVSSNAEVQSLEAPATRTVDLAGRLVLPGLCDSHIHFYDWCAGQNELALAGTRSKNELLQRLAARAALTPPTGWIVGQGWNESRWGESAFPTAADLDLVTGPDKPAILWRSDMHVAVANSAALATAGIGPDTADPAHGVIDRDERGRPTGVLRELAIQLVRAKLPPLDGQALDEAMRHGMQTLHRLGVTSIHDQRIKDHDEGPRALSAYQRLRAEGQLRLRVSCNVAAHDLGHLTALGLHTGFGDDLLRLGHVKVFADGSLGSRTAWMSEPYVKQEESEPDNLGVVVTPPEQMADEFRRATLLGFPVSVHAIGDQAVRVVLDIFEELADAGLTPPTPHRIEHVQTIQREDIPRLAALNLTASVQPLHATDDMDTADLMLGPRGAMMYNFRSLADAGVRLALGSDAPVASPNPFLGFHAALTRQRPELMDAPPWYPDERLTLEQVIHGYTLGAAQATGWDKVAGSIRPGKRADLIVLDRDLFTLVEGEEVGAEIAETQVEMTVFDGEIVFD